MRDGDAKYVVNTFMGDRVCPPACIAALYGAPKTRLGHLARAAASDGSRLSPTAAAIAMETSSLSTFSQDLRRVWELLVCIARIPTSEALDTASSQCSGRGICK